MAVNFDNFYSAMDARQIAIGQRSSANNILAEINILQLAIDSGAASGELIVDYYNTSTITLNGITITGSPMTIDTGNVYFNAWFQPDMYQTSPYLSAQAQMNQVVAYFSTLGYSIKRYRNGTNNNFFWQVQF